MEILRAVPFICSVHMVEIFRMKEGPDHVNLHTNLPNPRFPFQGGMSFNTTCDRETGDSWVNVNFPGVEVHVYDYSLGRIVNGRYPARPRQLQAAEAIGLQVVA